MTTPNWYNHSRIPHCELDFLWIVVRRAEEGWVRENWDWHWHSIADLKNSKSFFFENFSMRVILDGICLFMYGRRRDLK